MPEFILTTRGDLPNYYVSYRNPLTGKYGTKKSTGTSDKRQAEKIAYTWLISGEFEKRGNCSSKSLIDALKLADLTLQDTAVIVDILKKKELLVSAVCQVRREFSAFIRRDFSGYRQKKLFETNGSDFQASLHTIRVSL